MRGMMRNRKFLFVHLLIVPVIAVVLACVPALSAEAPHAMVVSESEQATQAGLEILKKGGNAIDAACATALALGVTNPASCGLGGGGFMLIYVARQGKFFALDFRETAPRAASADMYFRNGHPDEKLALLGPLAVGVPGQVAGIAAALERFGTMKFQQVAAPAIKLARNGFPLSHLLAGEIRWSRKYIADNPEFAKIFLEHDGSAPPEGAIIRQPELARTLEMLGDRPDEKFYHGAIARQIASYIRKSGGIMTADDLADYRALWREPLHRAYQGTEVYVMPPPSSGGVLLEMLGMLEPGHLPGLGLNSPPYLARLAEVMRQGFIDRALYADPAFVHVPLDVLLSAKHINEARNRALHHDRASRMIPEAHDHGTSNLCVVDKDGNVVALTTTINTIFGSKMMVPKLGIVLNNEMDDFAVAPKIPNVYRLQGAKANQIAPGKRPLSSMTPIIVVRKGRPVMTTGGSGGPTILTGVLQVTLDILDFHLGPEQAVSSPRIHEQASPDVIFAERAIPASTRDALSKMGYKLRVVPHLGAVNAITIEPGNLHGAFDPRKGGGAEGY